MAAAPDVNVVESRFTNTVGELWLVELDPTTGSGRLLGDETAWESVRIEEDKLDSDWMLARDEGEWISRVWWATRGRPLQYTSTDDAVRALMRSRDWQVTERQ